MPGRGDLEVRGAGVDPYPSKRAKGGERLIRDYEIGMLVRTA